MQHRKIQIWASGIAAHNSGVEYIKGCYKSCADLVSCNPKYAGPTQEKDIFELDINDKAYEIGALKSNRFNPSKYARSQNCCKINI